MSASVNTVILIGNLGADPELRYTGSNKPVCNLSVATSFRPKAGPDKTQWHRVVVWSADAENCAKFLKKGKPVYIQGRLETRAYESGGIKRYATEVIAERIVFLQGGEAPANQQQRDPAAPLPQEPEGPGAGEDDIPW